MKNTKLTLAAILFALFLVLGANNKAQAQDVIAAANNLVNLQVDVHDIDITVVDVVDVSNVLNQNDVDIIDDILILSRNDELLTNVLKDADIITGNQVVVGVVVNLLGGVEQILVADKDLFKQGKKK
jgi:hypothetical protein